MATTSQSTYRGWDVLHAQTDELRVSVVPGKGGDITSLLWRATGTELLFASPWGLRLRGAATQSGGSEARTTDWYPGGWQTMFPNAGTAAHEHGVQWPYHGEVWATPFDWVMTDEAIVLTAHLSRSPFHVTKTVQVQAGCVTVSETIHNTSAETIEVMWGHHPAFGAPLLSPTARIHTSAQRVHVDPAGPYERWPTAHLDGALVDLSRVPVAGSGAHRLIYLTEFGDQASLALVNDDLGLRADVRWNGHDFPCAWYWLEAGGSAGYPYYSSAYVLGLEPSTSWPAKGITTARATTATQVPFAPGQSRTAAVCVEVTATSTT